jgi:hypothetical protein
MLRREGRVVDRFREDGEGGGAEFLTIYVTGHDFFVVRHVSFSSQFWQSGRGFRAFRDSPIMENQAKKRRVLGRASTEK